MADDPPAGSPANPPSVEPSPRRRRWRKTLVIGVLAGVLLGVPWFYWSRRTMFAIHSVSGTFDTHAGFRHTIQVAKWAEWGGTRLSRETFDTVRRTLPWLNTDSDVRGVVLHRSLVESDWLRRLGRLSTLESLSLHDRQIGPELSQLGNLPSSSLISISDRGFDALARMTALRELSFGVGELTSVQANTLRLRMPGCEITAP